MNPSKSEKKSRRSSILKPPKPRQPLQNVELNASSTENSPASTTVKVKRRVSFAEKKHVKEFCDTVEQGTMWDNSYEESESSHTKNGHNSNNDENVMSKEAAKQQAKVSTELEIKESNFALEKTRISIEETAVTVTQSVTTENRKFLVDGYFKTVNTDFSSGAPMTEAAQKKPSGIPFPSNHSGSFNARRSLSVTENFLPLFGKSPNKRKSFLVESVESCSAKAAANTDETGLSNPPSFVPSIMQDDDCNEVAMEETLIGDLSVESTNPTSLTLSKGPPLHRASFNVVPNLNFSKNDPSQRFSAVSRADQTKNPESTIVQTEANEGQTACSKDQRRISVYHDASMEITESVTNRMSVALKHGSNKLGVKEPNRESILGAEEKTNFQMKTVETVTKILGLSGSGFEELARNDIDLRPERMPLFRNKSLGSVEVLQNTSRTLQLGKPPSEKTTVFHEEPVDFTEMVQNLHNDNKPDESEQERTTKFRDKALGSIEAVENGANGDQLQKLSTERSTIFHDEPLERNEVVRNVPHTEKRRSLSEERTTLFHNGSLDFTEVARSNPSCGITSNLLIQQEPPEKTAIFLNQPVDMTEVIQTVEGQEKSPPERTTIFHNKSVDMTEVVPSCSRNEKPGSEKTTIFNNQLVDETEVIRSRACYENPTKTPPEKTTIFANQSVDMTEVVQSCLRYEKTALEKTSIFDNQLVDVTEVIRSNGSYENTAKTPPEKTTIFHNQSVDMTEVVRSSPSYEKPEKNTIFDDKSVDTTEVVQSRRSHEILKKLPSERATISQSQLGDSSEVVRNGPNHEKRLKKPLEKRSKFHEQPVDTAEVIQSNPSIDRGDEKCPDMSEVVPEESSGARIQNPTQQSLEHGVSVSKQQRASVFHDTSAGLRNEVEKAQEPSEDQTPEATEAASSLPKVSRLLSRDSCTLAVERMAKQKPLDLEEANRLIASIEVKNPDPEVRSPAPKRMKSLGTRQSIDITAAVPFVVYRKLARQQCDESESTNCKQPSVEVNFETLPKSPVSGDMSMDMTEAIAGSSDFDPAATTFNVRTTKVQQDERDENTNWMNKSMEMTEAIPCLHPIGLTLPKYPDTNGDDGDECQGPQDDTMCPDDSMEMTRAIPGILKAKAAILHDDSMEMTKAVVSTSQDRGIAKENPDGAARSQFSDRPASEGETVVFRDDLMELTSGVKLSSQPIKGRSWSNDVGESKRDGDTMVYRDDSMELTRAVAFAQQVQTNIEDKENCPLGMENRQSRSSGRSETKSLGVSKNEWLEMMKSVPFLSSQKNKEGRVERIGSEEQRGGTGSDDITGIVPFATEIEDENGDGGDLGRDGNAMSEKTEMTEAVRWSSGLKTEDPEHGCDDVNLQPQLPEIEKCPPGEKIQNRQSNVAKNLFQKPVPSAEPKRVNKKRSETSDLDAEIRKLAESFALANSVDETGFDEATFLRQQARCMEDYEANSTASQEYHSGALSARKNASFKEKRDFPELSGSNSPKDSDGQEGSALPTVVRVDPADSKVAGTSVSNKDNSIVQNNSVSRMDNGNYDRSLEELRCRAYSVNKFRPEEGFELTAAISTVGPGHESIFAEEPPSFVFADSITVDSVTDRALSVTDLPTVPSAAIDGGEVRARNSLETSHSTVHHLAETNEISRDDKPEVEMINVTQAAESLESDANNSANNSQKIRRQTFVIKRTNSDTTIAIPSSPEVDKETRNDRRSGVTTAGEFTSESPDGPSEKIRRRESGLDKEEPPLPTVGKEGTATELIEIGRDWGNTNFVNSTAIGDEFTRQFGHQGLEETSITLESQLADEMMTETAQKDGKTGNLWPEPEEANEIAMELEISGPKSPFAVLKETIEDLAKRPDTVWRINRLDEKIVAFNFFSKTIVLAVYLNDNAISDSTNPIKVIGFLSQLVEEGTDPGVCLAHSLIMKKVNSASLTQSYQTYEDVPRLLEFVSAEVKLGMDFMFELDRLRDRTIMDIHSNRITFMVRTRNINAGIILSITMEIKPFEEISSNDITVAYLLGGEKVRENDIKRLITNVKRDHRFLRFYINDVRDYIDLMAETGFSTKIRTQ